MKSLIISSNSSNSGKTVISLGLLNLLKNKGFDVQGFKIGPDYIDTDFYTFLTNKNTRNLDLFLMKKQGVISSYNKGTGQFSVIEGAMGLYDGLGITSKYSTAEIAKLLNLPVLLILSPKGKSSTLFAEINGLKNYSDISIGGIILNKISEKYFKLLKAGIEKFCKIPVYGYLPKIEELNLPERYLGLVQSCEISNLSRIIDLCTQNLEKYCNIEKLMMLFKTTKLISTEKKYKWKNFNIAVARDKAFKFCYQDNIELLEQIGKIKYFSPLKDKKLPEKIDFLYITGGYPEIFIEELSKNKSMLKDIQKKLNNNLRCYAECGGLMYLTKGNKANKLVEFFEGEFQMTNALQNFGYAQIKIIRKNNFINKGLKINCHEFHKSVCKLKEQKIFQLTKKMYDNSIKQWECGYMKKNTLACYAHINFKGNYKFFENILGINN